MAASRRVECSRCPGSAEHVRRVIGFLERELVTGRVRDHLVEVLAPNSDAAFARVLAVIESGAAVHLVPSRKVILLEKASTFHVGAGALRSLLCF